MVELFNSILHIDVTLALWAQNYGALIYFILFAIIFCETGLVVTPFLPGDSLLFAVGALTATQDFLKIEQIIPLLILAAVLGDSTNFFIGQTWGVRLFQKNIFILKPKYLVMTEEFFAKKGIWAVSLSRFFPLIRTFAPFFAGMSKMKYKSFLLLSFVGSIFWVFIFVLAGFFFGQIEIIQKNFTLLVMGIVIFSLTPLVITSIRSNFLKNT
jgi:membrane-associated protein